MLRWKNRSPIGGHTPEGFKEALEMARATILGAPEARSTLNINFGNKLAKVVCLQIQTRNAMEYLEAVKWNFPHGPRAEMAR